MRLFLFWRENNGLYYGGETNDEVVSENLRSILVCKRIFGWHVYQHEVCVKSNGYLHGGKNNGDFDEVTRAKLMKLARKYQMEDPLHENVYDIIRKFDECINILNIGIHYF